VQASLTFTMKDYRVPEPLQPSPGLDGFEESIKKAHLVAAWDQAALVSARLSYLGAGGRLLAPQPRFYRSYPAVQLHKLAAK
jgi:hypothetical protein